MASVLYNIIVAPIELVVEVVFEVLFRLVGHRVVNQSIAVIGVSVVISLLTLPLYRKADEIQKAGRDEQKRMSGWIAHIRKTFKGDERFMMLQTYYRINNYSPIYIVKSALPLLLQIPFFTAAYHFLSNLEVLHGASFGPIVDLGAPDAILKFGDLSFNVLPIMMTVINCVASAIYLKGFALKDKIQTYGLAVVFLILLYNSPSGLVIYWTCNNLFSLVKNIFYKLKNPRKTLNILCSALGFIFLIVAFINGLTQSRAKAFLVWVIFFTWQLPLILSLIKNINLSYRSKKDSIFDSKADPIENFVLPAVLLVVIIGILIPSSVISSSPAEFVDLTNYKNPLLYLVNSVCYAAGFFLLWSGIIRYIITEKGKKIFSLILWICCGVFLTDYLFFGKNLGILSPLLVYETPVTFSRLSNIINTLVVFAVVIVFYYLFRFKKFANLICAVFIIGTSVVSVSQIVRTKSLLNDMSYMKDIKRQEPAKSLYTLSKKGKNVIVFMLDRAISGYVPYIFNEKPELKKQFEGFTYYPNALSHGRSTNYGTPELFGGYEYTPVEMNKRSEEKLKIKQNEALKLMPVLFDQNNFNVTVCDPPYAGYTWIPDLSIYDEYPNIKKYITSGTIINSSLIMNIENDSLSSNKRNFFCYSLFRVVPQVVSPIIYHKGDYFSSAENTIRESRFIKEYSVLTLLSKFTKISNESKGEYLSIVNGTTHEPQLLQLPDYEVKEQVDNTGYTEAVNGYIKMETEQQIMTYHVNVASLMALGKWFDFMRENDVWDNTRIILVADHGDALGQFDYMIMDNLDIDVQAFNPLFMVKDFNSKEYTVSKEFMTLADVPFIAFNEVIRNPINPFTGKIVNNEEKKHLQIITTSAHSDVSTNNGTTFDTSDGHWYSVHDDIFNEKNWEMVE